MATKTIELELLLNSNKTNAGATQAVKSLKQVEEQANRTREKMEKLANVGAKLALVGGAMVAPFALALKKYTDTIKDAEPLSRRMVELGKKWEESQIRLGRVTAEIVLPALEKGAAILENVISFAEKNPGVVKAALTIGTTLVILGGLITTTAQLVSTIATIQGLAASAGLASAGGGVAAGVAGGAAAGGGLAAAVASGITIAIPLVIGLIAAAIGGTVGLGVGNAIAGTNQTWKDIGDTLYRIWKIDEYFLTKWLPKALGDFFYNLGVSIGNAIRAIPALIGSWFKGGKASGGYMSQPGLYAGAERGREFVLNAPTTAAAERAIGGRLNQTTAAAMLTNNINIANGMTVSQTRRMIAGNNKQIMNSLLSL